VTPPPFATIAPMRLLFLGSGEFGLPTLQSLARAHQIVGVVTQPDRPAGRGRGLTPTPIGAWTAANLPTTPLVKPENINDPAVVAHVRAIAAPPHALAWVVIAFGQKLGRPLLQSIFAINLHASLLPRWRGAAPINAAILAGDRATGNTVITLADRMDAGEILAQSTRTIEPMHTAGTLHDALSADGPALVERVLADHAAGTLGRRSQDESLATKAPKLSKADGWIDLSQPADHCRWRVHALTPWPGVTLRLAAPGFEQELKVTLVRDVPSNDRGRVDARLPPDAQPGTLVDPALGLVQCGQGTLLRLLMVTPPGKRSMAWGQFVQGRAIPAATRVIGGQPA